MREVSLPNDWELKKISEIGEIISGGTPNTENENYWKPKLLNEILKNKLSK